VSVDSLWKGEINEKEEENYPESMKAIIHSQSPCDISTLETYYLNFIASQLYTQKVAVVF